MKRENVVTEGKIGEYRYQIVVDMDPQNPRTEFDNAGKLWIDRNRSNRYGTSDDGAEPVWHNYAELHAPIDTEIGDDPMDGGPGFSLAQMLELWEKETGGVSIALRSGGQYGETLHPTDDYENAVAVLYCEGERVAAEWGEKGKKPSAAIRAKARRCLRGEIEEYNHWATGEVYGFIIEKAGEEVDSCWGFYGDYRDCEKEAENVIRDMRRNDRKEAKRVRLVEEPATLYP